MKTLAALFLAGLLAVMAYGIFWLVCLNFTTAQLRDAVQDGLQAKLAYGSPQWVPDPAHVTMDLPSAVLSMEAGPVREIRADTLRVESSFLNRDSWVLNLPQRLDVVLRSGVTVKLETDNAKVTWFRDDNRLSLRAESIRLLNRSGAELARLDDMALDRKAADRDVKLNLASRPRMTGGEAVITGQMSMPADAFAAVVDLFGEEALPTLGDMMRVVVASLQAKGGELKMDNVSFKLMPQGVNGAVLGTVRVQPNGVMVGNVGVTSSDRRQIVEWVRKAGVLNPRTPAEMGGVVRFERGADALRAARLENMQSKLVLNGYPVGQLPQATAVVNNLWPERSAR